MKTLHTVAEVAEETGVSKGKLYGMVQRGEIPCYRFGDLVRLNLEEVLALTRDEARRPSGCGPEGRK
jgi:excisionase family DNA binding protein